MKKFCSLLLALAMVAQMMLGGVVLAEATPVTPDVKGALAVSTAGDYVYEGDVTWVRISNRDTEETVTLLVTGNAEGDGVDGLLQAFTNAQLTVDGDVIATHVEEYDQKYNGMKDEGRISEAKAMYAGNNAEINVTGDVNATFGIEAFNTARVTVDGNMEAGFVKYDKQTDLESGKVISEETRTSGYAVFTRDQAQVVVGGSINADEAMVVVEAYDQSVVTVGGDINCDNIIVTEDGEEIADSTGVLVFDSAIVNVGGNVNASFVGVDVGVKNVADDTDSSKITSGTEKSNAYVKVDGDVSGRKMAIYATGDAQVIVGGDVSSENDTAIVANDTEIIEDWYHSETDEQGITKWVVETTKLGWSDSGATVTVGGDVVSGGETAIEMSATATVKVEGDVTGADGAAADDDETEEVEIEGVEAEAIVVGVVELNYREESTGELVIKGTVASEGGALPLVVNVYTEGVDPEVDMEAAMPDVKVYEMKANPDGEYFDVNVFSTITTVNEEGEEEEYVVNLAQSEEDRKAMVEAIAAAIQYIIRVEQVANGTIDISGATYDAENDVMLANEGDQIAVNVSLEDGYQLDGVTGGEIAEVIDNGDGTWTVIVRRGGGVTISALISRTPEPEAPVEPAAPAEPEAPAPVIVPVVVAPAPVEITEGMSVRLGKTDLNGDGIPELLYWYVMEAREDGKVMIVLANGFEEMPTFEDIAQFFTEEELAGIDADSYTALDADLSKEFFGDDLIHVALYVDPDVLTIE